MRRSDALVMRVNTMRNRDGKHWRDELRWLSDSFDVSDWAVEQGGCSAGILGEDPRAYAPRLAIRSPARRIPGYLLSIQGRVLRETRYGWAFMSRCLIDIDDSVSFLSTGSLRDSYTSIRSCTNSMKALPTPGCSLTQANISLALEIFEIMRLKKPCSISLTLLDMRRSSN